MARTREFNEDAVLRAAMHVFRRDGYDGASVRALEAATGLKSGSIYNSYGDKQGLFDAAIDHYGRAVLQARVDRHAPPEAGLDGLRALFVSVLHERDGETLGCLVTNTAVETGGGQAPHAAVPAAFALLETLFEERLRREAERGRLAGHVEPALAATRLLALYQGVLVLVRARQDRGALARMLEREFDDLKAPL